MIFKKEKNVLKVTAKDIDLMFANGSEDEKTLHVLSDQFRRVGEYESLNVMITAMSSSGDHLNADFFQVIVDGVSILYLSSSTESVKLSKHQKEVLSHVDVIACQGIAPKNLEEVISDEEPFAVIFFSQENKLKGVEIEESAKKFNFKNSEIIQEERLTKYYVLT